MKQAAEFEGKSVDQAVETACEAFQVPKEKLKYDVLSYGSTGIFGLVGSKKARIRVTLPVSSLAEEPKREVKPVKPREPEEEKAKPESGAEAHPERREDPGEIELAAAGEAALKRILESITPETQVAVETGSEALFFNVKGGNSALLIGKRGQTLEAIQYLVEKIVNRKTDKRVRVRVDVEGYQKNRRISLERLAEKVSEKVKKTGKPVTLGDMNASDRRIVHLALKDDQEVRTQSKGGGALKKLFIFPKKKQSSKT